MSKELEKAQDYQHLVDGIGSLLTEGRRNAAYALNTVMVETYWHIGQYIVEYEQKGNERAVYGSDLINRLSRDLTQRYGKGFGKSNLLYIRKLYVSFPKSGTLSHLLTWSHYYEVLKCDDLREMNFYIKQCENEHWSVRELKRQMKSMLFHRLALSTDKEGVMALATEGQQLTTPEDIIRDPYVFDFVGLPDRLRYSEKDLEDALINNMRTFLLELGKGFAFVGQQYRVSIAGRHMYVDLVFYHRILKCFVLIDLKRGEIQHEDIGQMNLYLNYFKAEENVEGDNEPIGIVLGSSKNKLMMEYALNGITNQLFAAQYQLYLPNREELQARLDLLLNEMDAQDELNGE